MLCPKNKMSSFFFGTKNKTSTASSVRKEKKKVTGVFCCNRKSNLPYLEDTPINYQINQKYKCATIMDTPLICSHVLHAVRQVIRHLPGVKEPDDRSHKYRRQIHFRFNTFRGSTNNCSGSVSCTSNNDDEALTTLTDA